MAGGYPGPGQGVIRGYGFTRRARTHPSGKAASSGAGLVAERSAGVRAGATRPGPHPRGPRFPHQLPPESVAGRQDPAGLFPYFYSWAFKNSLALPRVALLVSSDFVFICIFLGG